MQNKSNIFLGILGGLAVGVTIGYAVSSAPHLKLNDEHAHEHEMDEMPKVEDHDHMSDDDAAVKSMDAMMHDMNAALEGKSGAEFDAMFLAQMIVHHEGAVDMAQAALERASSTELKALSSAIIEAQQSEIQQMEAWQLEWFGMPEVQ